MVGWCVSYGYYFECVCLWVEGESYVRLVSGVVNVREVAGY